MPRKTVNVNTVRDRVNGMLQTPDSSLYLTAPGKDRELTPAEAIRIGAIAVLESILHESGNYRGFGYQPGIVNYPDDGDPDKVTFGDETRRVYY